MGWRGKAPKYGIGMGHDLLGRYYSHPPVKASPWEPISWGIKVTHSFQLIPWIVAMSIIYQWGYRLEWVDTGHWTEGPHGPYRAQYWSIHVDRIAAHVDRMPEAYILLFLALHLNTLFTMPPTIRTALVLSRFRRTYVFSPWELEILHAKKKEIAGAP